MSNGRFIDEPPAGAAGWREVWREDRQYRAASGLTGLLRGFIRRLLRTDFERQRNFNLVTLDLLEDLRADFAEQVDALRRELESVRNDHRGDIDAVRRDYRGDIDAVLEDVRAGDAAVREIIPVASKRNDALIAALDQKIETLAVRIRDVTNPVVFGERPSATDWTYRRIEDSLRGAAAMDVEPYVTLARQHQPLVDVGCGRGELVEACRKAGISATGYDTNERSVADLEARGLDARVGGVPQCFEAHAAGSVGSIAAVHVVEHLPADVLFALFREAARVLRPGGLLMIETPNAESILMSASDFWRDPTHLAPRHPAALAVLAREHGFAIEEIRAVHDFPEGTRIAARPTDPPELQRVIEAINDRLFAPQDVRLIVRRPA